jgi:hypothetical protein
MSHRLSPNRGRQHQRQLTELEAVYKHEAYGERYRELAITNRMLTERLAVFEGVVAALEHCAPSAAAADSEIDAASRALQDLLAVAQVEMTRTRLDLPGAQLSTWPGAGHARMGILVYLAPNGNARDATVYLQVKHAALKQLEARCSDITTKLAAAQDQAALAECHAARRGVSQCCTAWHGMVCCITSQCKEDLSLLPTRSAIIPRLTLLVHTIPQRSWRPLRVICGLSWRRRPRRRNGSRLPTSTPCTGMW